MSLVGRWLKAGGVGLGLALLTLQPYSICPFAVVSGLPCPGCGITRSLVAMVQGDLQSAWHLHPLGPIFTAIGLGLVTLRLLRFRWRTKLTTYDWADLHAFVWWGALVVVMGIWAARFGGAMGGPAEVHTPIELLQTLNRK